MAEFECMDGRGFLFPNQKQGNPNAPQWQGVIKIDNVQVKLAAWSKTSKNGNQYLSLAVDSYGSTAKGPYPKERRDEDDVPF